MKQYDTVVIGFGKAGKTLAATLAKQGEQVALIEKSDQMYGGTCINIACIPTKTLEFKSRKSADLTEPEAKKARYKKAVAEKNALIQKLRSKNYQKVAAAGVEIIDGKAVFSGKDTVQVFCKDGSTKELTAERFLINTGAVPRTVRISGLENSSLVYTSTEIMALEELPEELVILGAGFIGIEFASYYANFGSKVTILQRDELFMPTEDREIAQAIENDLEERGIRILRNASLLSGKEENGRLSLHVQTLNEEMIIEASGLLLAIGRIPNTADLGLEEAGVALSERGGVVVDENLHTTNEKIWAAGDVKGQAQFTYLSLDDFRILLSGWKGEKERTANNRGLYPFVTFIDPPFARIGMTEEEAKQSGNEIEVHKVDVSGVPKAHILERPRGLMKLITEKGSGQILGAHLYCPHAEELIHIIQIAIDAKLPYTYLKNHIYAHPTMAEALNDI